MRSSSNTLCHSAIARALVDVGRGSSLEVFVLRPCIVAGPKATALADSMPWNRFPSAFRSFTRAIPLLKLPFPDPGHPLQLVHHHDVAAAIALAATASAPPGAYNIAEDGEVTLSNIAAALGGRPIRVPAATATIGSAVVARLPFLPAEAGIVHVARTSVVMDTGRAKALLGWAPKYNAAQTLEALAGAV